MRNEKLYLRTNQPLLMLKILYFYNDVLYSVLISSNVYLLQFEKIRSFGEEEDEQEEEKVEEEKVKETDFYHLCTTQTENNDALSK